MKYLNVWTFSAPRFQQLMEGPVKYYFTYLTVTPTFGGVTKSVPRVHPLESQKKPKGVNVEVQNCPGFSLASMYLAHSCDMRIQEINVT